MRFNINPCEILPLVNQAIEINQPFAARARVSIKLVQAMDAIAFIDPDRFIQAITNLLANAIKFSSNGDIVEVSIQLTGKHIRIDVTDHGIGVPESFHSTIFEKFSQADSTDSRKFGGTGLGLSIVKLIIEQFNGKVGFTSVPNQKTTFIVELPIYAAATSPAPKRLTGAELV